MRRHLLAWAVSVAAAVVGLTLALADDSSFGGAGSNIYPLENSTVSLEREHVCFYQREHDYWDVLAVLTFYNPADQAVHLQLGFPANVPGAEDNDRRPMPGERALEGRFRVSVNGHNTQTRLKKIRVKRDFFWADHAYLFAADFPPRSHTVIEHRYTIRQTDVVDSSAEIPYILATGRYWEGNIEEAVFEYRFQGRVFPQIVLNYTGPWGESPLVGRPAEAPYGDAAEFPQVKRTSRFEAGPRPRLTVTLFDIKPKGNIVLSGYSDMCVYSGECAWRAVCDRPLMKFYYKQNHPINDELLRCHEPAWWRNLIYASYGYEFRDEHWRQEFYDSGLFLPSQTPFDDSWLTPDDRAAIEKLKKLEARGAAPAVP